MERNWWRKKKLWWALLSGQVCERKKKRGVLVGLLSTSRDQLMAADDRAERGQGSKPCIVSLALLSHGVPSLSLAPLHPSSLHPSNHPSIPCCLLHIYIHLSMQRAAVARWARGCTVCVIGWLPQSLRHCSLHMHCKSHICEHFISRSAAGV